jgi:hypothetical protein
VSSKQSKAIFNSYSIILIETHSFFSAATNRLVKRSPIPPILESSDDSLFQKRTTALATTSAPVLTSSAAGGIASLSSSSQVYYPPHNNLVSYDNVPNIKEPPQLPPITGEALEVHNKFKSGQYNNRRMAYYRGYYGGPSRTDHPDLDEPGPWHKFRALDPTKGNSGQQLVKVLMYPAAGLGVYGCIKGICAASKAISKHTSGLGRRVAVVGSNAKQAVTGMGKTAVEAAKNRVKGATNYVSSAWKKTEETASDAKVQKGTEDKHAEQSDHHAETPSSSQHHPASAELPRVNTWEPVKKPLDKQHHAIEMRHVKRGLEEVSHQERCLESGRCNLFDDSESSRDIIGLNIDLLEGASRGDLPVMMPAFVNIGASHLRKRGLELATIATGSAASSQGFPSAVSSVSGSSHVHFPEHNNFVTAADIPQIREPPQLPPIKGEALEFYKKVNADIFSSRRHLKGGKFRWTKLKPKTKPKSKSIPAACTTCNEGLDKEKHQGNPSRRGPWHGKNALNLHRGNPAQQAAKVGIYIVAPLAMAACTAASCIKRKAIKNSAARFKNNVYALPQSAYNGAARLGNAGMVEIKRLPQRPRQVKEYVGTQGPIAIRAGRERLTQIGNRASQFGAAAWNKASAAASLAMQKVKTLASSRTGPSNDQPSNLAHVDIEELSRSSSYTSLQHPAFEGHPRHDTPWSDMHKDPREVHISGYTRRYRKRNFDEEDYQVKILASNRRNLFGDGQVVPQTNLQSVSMTSIHSTSQLAVLVPILSFGFALTVGSIWLSLALAKSSQLIGKSGYQSLLDLKGQDVAIAIVPRPALLLLPLATTLGTVTFGSIYAFRHSALSRASCNIVTYTDSSDTLTDVAMSKRMSPRGRKAVENAAVLGISAGAAAVGFMGIKALLGSTPPVEKRGLTPLHPISLST